MYKIWNLRTRSTSFLSCREIMYTVLKVNFQFSVLSDKMCFCFATPLDVLCIACFSDSSKTKLKTTRKYFSPEVRMLSGSGWEVWGQPEVYSLNLCPTSLLSQFWGDSSGMRSGVIVWKANCCIAACFLFLISWATFKLLFLIKYQTDSCLKAFPVMVSAQPRWDPETCTVRVKYS